MSIESAIGFGTGALATDLGFTSGNTIDTTSPAARFSGGRLQVGSGNGSFTFGCATSGAKKGIHIGFYSVSGAGGNIQIVNFREGGTIHVSFDITGTGFIRASYGNSLGTSTTSSYQVPAATWIGLEFYVEVHDSAGVVKAYVNGSSTPIINVSGVDTKNGQTGVIDTFGCNNSTGGAGNTYYCDWVVYNNSGSVNNAPPIGDVRVETIYPNGNGNSSQFVGSDSNSTDNYLLVDETPYNSDTDYVESSTVGQKDTYAFGNITPATGTVLAVQARLVAKKTDAGTREIKPVYRLSSTEVDGTIYPLTNSYAISPGDIQETKPGGGAWTITDVNNAEFGVKVV